MLFEENRCCTGADRYKLLCCPVFVPAFNLSQSNFKVISPSFGTDLYFTEIYQRTILISQCSGFLLKSSLRVCVAASVSI